MLYTNIAHTFSPKVIYVYIGLWIMMHSYFIPKTLLQQNLETCLPCHHINWSDYKVSENSSISIFHHSLVLINVNNITKRMEMGIRFLPWSWRNGCESVSGGWLGNVLISIICSSISLLAQLFSCSSRWEWRP